MKVRSGIWWLRAIVASTLLGVGWQQVLAGEPAQDFEGARSHFVRGRELQRLHRNTAESSAEFSDALTGFGKAAAAAEPGTRLAARAQYMAGSACLFLDQPEDAISNYAKVLSLHPDNSEYWEKAAVRKAEVESDYLKPEAARQSLAVYFKRFPSGFNAAQHKQARKLEKALSLIGTAAPPLEVQRWFNTESKPKALFGEKAVMLYFWASWCPNCLKEVRFITDLDKRYRPRGLQLIGVTAHSRGQTDEKVAAYIRDHGFNFPVAVDDRGATSRRYQGESVPTAVLVDRAGRIRWHGHPAALSESVIDRLLKGNHRQ